MVSFQNASLKQKLKLVMMCTSVISIALVCSGLFIYEYYAVRGNLINDLTTKGEIIGANCQAAIAFDNSTDANKTLGTLASQPSIMAAAVFTGQEVVFASYVNPGLRATLPQQVKADGYYFEDGTLNLFQPIVLNNARIGTMFLSSNMDRLYTRFSSFMQIVCLVLISSLAVAYVLASKLQHRISRPVSELVETTEQISRMQDYSLRAKKGAADEFGSLADAFNAMLAQIQERDANLRLTHEAMRNSERRFRALIEHGLDSITLMDENSTILYVSPAVVNIEGYRPEDLVGRSGIENTHPDDLSMVQEIVRNLIAHPGKPAPIRWRRRHKNGEWLWLEGFATNMLHDPAVRAIVTNYRDVTERMRAETALRDSESRYRTSLDHLMEGCQIIGFDWSYLYVNDVAALQGRCTKDKMLGFTMMEIYPGIEKTLFFALLRRCMAERVPQRMENLFTFPDGATGWFNLSMEPVPEGMFILSEDITEEKRLNDELAEHRDHLEELVAERTAELEIANKELEAFSYSVSHDLRAPLRHIHGFAELLTEHAGEKLDGQGRQFLSTISTSAQQMGVLIDELLMFSRMGRSEMRSTVVDLNQMVRETLGTLEPECKDRQIEWRIARLPCVRADPSMMRLVFVNLFSNAIKYTRTRANALIEVSLGACEGGMVVRIQDNGVGFDMQHEDKLFGVFQRLHRAEEFEGTGIGLANVRRIIQRHGGKTWAEGTVGVGAAFSFSLPTIAEVTV